MEVKGVSIELFQILTPFIMFAVNLLTQVIGCRYVVGLSLLKSVFFGYGNGLVCLLVVEVVFLSKEIYLFSEFLSILTVNFVIYSVFGYWYFIFITLLETAIRTRLVLELNKSKEGLSEDEILMKYNSKELIDKRINRLMRNGQILNNGDRYCSGKSSLLLFCKFSEVLHRIVPGEKREA